MTVDLAWNENINKKLKWILSIDLIWIILFALSSLGFVIGLCILSIAFGVTDQLIQGVFIRLAPLAFLLGALSVLNFIYLWHAEVEKGKLSKLRIQIKAWESDYELTKRALGIIFFFPALLVWR